MDNQIIMENYLLVLKNSVHLKGITSGKTEQTNRVLEYLLSL